jgi:orotidine-5'-phosphate decarboxylase
LSAPVSASPVIVALDFANGHDAITLVDQLDPALCRLKVGKELFTREGPALVKRFVDSGYDVFLDLKFHDIPNTTAKAVAAAADLGVWMVNVHCSGGSRMLEAAASQLQAMGSATLLIGVTVLTSMGAEDLNEIGVSLPPDEQVIKLASLASAAGLNGVVCSAREAGEIGRQFGAQFLRVTPGIRPANSARDDQVRVMTPVAAMENGSTHLVIGRPITAATDPKKALLEIVGQLGNH